MRKGFKLLSVVWLIVIWCVAGCTGSADQPTPTNTPQQEAAESSIAESESAAIPELAADPATAVVLEMVARANAEDFAGAAELVADDVMAYFIGMPPTGMEIYWGQDQFQTFMEECCTGQHFVWEVVPERVEDGVVYAESKTWMDFTRDLGVAPNSWHEIFVVNDDKISMYVSTITEEALANFKPVLYEAIPDLAAAAQPATASDETPASEIDVTITNSTCAYDGPVTFQEGELTVNVDVQDQRFDKYAVTFFTLDEGRDMVDLMASTHNPGPPSWSDNVFYKELGPGESETYKSFYVKEGLLYLVCWGGPPDIAIGNAGPFLVQK